MCSPSARNRGRTSGFPRDSDPGNIETGRLPLTRRPRPVPDTEAVPGRGISRVNRSKWSLAAAVGPFRYGGGGRLRATAPQSRRPPAPAHYLKPSVCVWPLPLPSPPTHTFFTSYWPRSASLLVLMLTMLTVIGIIHSITVPRLNIYLYV